MKVKLNVSRTIEIEVNDPAVAELDALWRNADRLSVTPVREVEELTLKAVRAVEEASGIPFGEEDAPETIWAVSAMDDEPILEW